MSFYTSISHLYNHIFPVKQPMIAFCECYISEMDRLLEVGCATGNLIEAINNSKREIVGIDFDEEMIEIAKKRFEDNKNITLVQGDMRLLSRFVEKFDPNSSYHLIVKAEY